MNPLHLREIFLILHNVDLADLVGAGIIDSEDNTIQWKRFNNNLTSFVLRLGPGRLLALTELIEGRMGK